MGSSFCAITIDEAMAAAEICMMTTKKHEYDAEAVAICSDLRASSERGLEDVAFSRVIQRHRDYIDTKLLKGECPDRGRL